MPALFPIDPTLTKIIGKDLTRLVQSFLLETDKSYMTFRACALTKISENISQGCSQVVLHDYNFSSFDPSWVERLAKDLSMWGYFIQTEWARRWHETSSAFMQVFWSREVWQQYAVDYRVWLKNRAGHKDFESECESSDEESLWLFVVNLLILNLITCVISCQEIVINVPHRIWIQNEPNMTSIAQRGRITLWGFAPAHMYTSLTSFPRGMTEVDTSMTPHFPQFDPMVHSKRRGLARFEKSGFLDFALGG